MCGSPACTQAAVCSLLHLGASWISQSLALPCTNYSNMCLGFETLFGSSSMNLVGKVTGSMPDDPGRVSDSKYRLIQLVYLRFRALCAYKSPQMQGEVHCSPGTSWAATHSQKGSRDQSHHSHGELALLAFCQGKKQAYPAQVSPVVLLQFPHLCDLALL